MEAEAGTAGASWRRPPPTRRQRRVDVAVALALAAGTIASVLLARAGNAALEEVAERGGRRR